MCVWGEGCLSYTEVHSEGLGRRKRHFFMHLRTVDMLRKESKTVFGNFCTELKNSYFSTEGRLDIRLFCLLISVSY